LARDTTEENLQARCRGTLLMAISNKKGYLVLTTGNKSEMAVGYATLYGDMAGGFDVLKDVPKTLVFRLCEYRNSLGAVIPQRVIERHRRPSWRRTRRTGFTAALSGAG
jgi:NAD+ synthase (glutamine-hydrolysing)